MEKKTLTAIITGGKDDFGIFFQEDIPASGAGETVEEAKENFLEGIRLFIEMNDSKNIPDVLKGEYEIVYSFDASGALKYYSNFMSYSGIQKLTGINQRQLSNYANGYRSPSKKTAEKILSGLHGFANELSQINIVF